MSINKSDKAIETLIKASELIDENNKSLSINSNNLVFDTSYSFILKIKENHTEKVINMYKLIDNNLQQKYINLISISDITKNIISLKNSTRGFRSYKLNIEKMRIDSKLDNRLFLTKKGLDKFIKYVEIQVNKKVNMYSNNRIDNNEFVKALLFIRNNMI